MHVIDPGHEYVIDIYDGIGGAPIRYVRFMKRIGQDYPGNEPPPAYPGTNLQELLRVQIDRLKYLDRQDHSPRNGVTIALLRGALWQLEARAGERRGVAEPNLLARAQALAVPLESIPTCPTCGHILCEEEHL